MSRTGIRCIARELVGILITGFLSTAFVARAAAQTQDGGSLGINSDGTLLAKSTPTGARIFTLPVGKVGGDIHIWEPPSHPTSGGINIVEGLRFLAEAKPSDWEVHTLQLAFAGARSIVVCPSTGNPTLFDLGDPRQPTKVREFPAKGACLPTVSPDGHYLAVRWWDEKKRSTYQDLVNSIRSLVFDIPTGRLCADLNLDVADGFGFTADSKTLVLERAGVLRFIRVGTWAEDRKRMIQLRSDRDWTLTPAYIVVPYSEPPLGSTLETGLEFHSLDSDATVKRVTFGDRSAFKGHLLVAKDLLVIGSVGRQRAIHLDTFQLVQNPPIVWDQAHYIPADGAAIDPNGHFEAVCMVYRSNPWNDPGHTVIRLFDLDKREWRGDLE